MTSMTILLLLGLAGALLVVNAQTPYCQSCSFHTMCQTTTNGRTCHGKALQSKPPSLDEKIAILHSHNKLRNKVAKGEETQGNGGSQPSAANMMLMKWDSELATIAQRAADQCVYNHDCSHCRALNRDRKSVGQNVAIETHYHEQTAVNWARMVEYLYNTEVHLMSPDSVSNYVHHSSWGHYSQMVWWNSRLVGCGASMYKEGTLYATLIFCNYRTGANSVGAKVYEVGPPASNCPRGTRASHPLYSALCVTEGLSTPSTFHTDGKMLGIPGYYSVVGSCERAGFRIPKSAPIPTPPPTDPPTPTETTTPTPVATK